MPYPMPKGVVAMGGNHHKRGVPQRTLYHGRFTVIKELAKGQFGEALLVKENPVRSATNVGGRTPSTSPIPMPLSRIPSTKSSASADSTGEAPPPRLFVVKRIMSQVSREVLKAADLEVKAIRALQHPGIVRFHGVFKTEGHIHLQLEYCDGGDLEGLIKGDGARYAKRPIPEARLMSYLLQILDATAYMHKHHVIHRDLKLANIFLSNDKQLIKIGDFGLSKLLSTSDEAAKTMAGTPYYFSPELAAGQEYTSKTDIFSLGVLFFELMTRKKPFSGRDLRAVLRATQFDQTPDLKDTVAKVWGHQQLHAQPPTTGTTTTATAASAKPIYSDQLIQMVLSMLEKDPRCRPTAAELLGSAAGPPAVTVRRNGNEGQGSLDPSTVAVSAAAKAQPHTDPFTTSVSSASGKQKTKSASTTSASGQIQHLMLAQAVVLNVRQEPRLDADVVGRISFRDQAIITKVDDLEVDNRIIKKQLGTPEKPVVPKTLLWYKVVRPVKGWMIADLANGSPLFSLWKPDAPPLKRPAQAAAAKPTTTNVQHQQPDRRGSPPRCEGQQQQTRVKPTCRPTQPLSPVNKNLSPRQSPLKQRAIVALNNNQQQQRSPHANMPLTARGPKSPPPAAQDILKTRTRHPSPPSSTQTRADGGQHQHVDPQVGRHNFLRSPVAQALKNQTPNARGTNTPRGDKLPFAKWQ